MLISDAQDIAAGWVRDHAATIPGFEGAFFTGSAIWQPADELLAPSSDLDVMVVTGEPGKLGKFRHRDVLIEVSYLPWERLATPELVLGSYHVAGAFRTNTIIADPTGRLSALHRAVAPEYGKAHWIRRRCENAEEGLVSFAGSVTGSPAAELPWPRLVTAWAFACGVTTHVLLTAGLRNPTVRRRYSAALDLLRSYGRSEWHEQLLALLGCAHFTAGQTGAHLAALEPLFDRAARLRERSFRFAADLTTEARPVAIGGSRELIERGEHREAVFWIIATYARCLVALEEETSPGFDALLADLGVTGRTELESRARAVLDFLPTLREQAETIIRESAGTRAGPPL